jgi:hypothetical protein
VASIDSIPPSVSIGFPQRLEQFTKAGDWAKKVAGDIDWIKRLRYNQTLAVKMGVEVQVSARSDLLVRDLVHLRNSLQEGIIDIGVIIVPSDKTQTFLTDRTPSLKDAIRYVEQEFQEATKYPLVIIAVEHDGPRTKLFPRRRPTAARRSPRLEVGPLRHGPSR